MFRWIVFMFYSSLTGRFFQHLSASGLTVMATTALPFPYFDKIVAEHQIQLSAKRHRG
jgi:hypothetical protein